MVAVASWFWQGRSFVFLGFCGLLRRVYTSMWLRLALSGMFVSLYLLYRYARSSKSKSYLFDIGLFLILVSLVSASYPFTGRVWFSLPLSFVSFPFYSWIGDLPIPEAMKVTYPLVFGLPYHSVRFLTVDLNLTPDWALTNGELVDLEVHVTAFLVAFLVCLLVNVLGGVVGYFVGRRYEVRILNWKRGVVVGFVFLLVWFVGVLVERFAGFVVVERVSMAVFGFGVAVFAALAVSFLIQFVKQARIPTLMVLTGLAVFLLGQNVVQGDIVKYEVMVGGQMLIVLGALALLLKAVLEYSRTQAPAGVEKPVGTQG